MSIKVREGGAWVEVSSGGGSGGSSDPIGTIVTWASSTPPTGWLECNGQSTSGYTELAALIGSNVPDLRGEFVRGWDNSAGIDTGRTLGSTQSDEFKEHNHTIVSFGRVNVNPNGVQNPFYSRSGEEDTSSVGGTETRPRNVALMYIIKHTATSGGSSGSGTTKVALLSDKKSSGTDGGTFTAGSWVDRTLNTEVDPQNFVTLDSGNVYWSLEAGTYRITWSAPAYRVSNHASALWYSTSNTFSSYTSVEGSSEYSDANRSPGNQTRSFGDTTITISQTTYFKIKHKCGSTQQSYGLGVGSGLQTEVYTQASITDLG